MESSSRRLLERRNQKRGRLAPCPTPQRIKQIGLTCSSSNDCSVALSLSRMKGSAARHETDSESRRPRRRIENVVVGAEVEQAALAACLGV